MLNQGSCNICRFDRGSNDFPIRPAGDMIFNPVSNRLVVFRFTGTFPCTASQFDQRSSTP